ncbi:unnamed protein product, partial [Polarella glacialis]
DSGSQRSGGAGSWRDALYQLHRRLSEASVISDPQKARIGPAVFISALRACDRAREWSWALHVLSLMRKRGFKESVVHLGAAAGACGKASEWMRALGILAECPQLGVSPD